MDYNDEYFISKQKIIDELTKDLDDKRYIKLCFIDFFDKGDSIFTIDNYGVSIYINKGVNPKDYRERPEYLITLSNIYNQVLESIEKVKIRFEPFSISVEEMGGNMLIRVDIIKGRLEEERRIKESESEMKYSGFGRYKRPGVW